MASLQLDRDSILDLLKGESLEQKPTTGYPPPEQHGPLRWYDKEMRCLQNRKCGSPTYCKVNGIPMCTMHAMKELNEMCVKLEEAQQS